MQKKIIFTFFLLTFALFSCETLEYRSYKLHARNIKQEEQLGELLDQEGIYKVSLDSVNHELSFMYAASSTDLSDLDLFFENNNLINLDTSSQLVDSSYLLVEQQNAVIDSLARLDSIAEAEAYLAEQERIKQLKLDSLARVLEQQDSLRMVEDTTDMPVLDLLEVF